MTARRFTGNFPILLACTVVASLAQSAVASERPSPSVTDMLGIEPVLGAGGDTAVSDNMAPAIDIRNFNIPAAGGMTFGADGQPRNDAPPACQVFSDLASFNTAYNCGYAKPCNGSQCLENFDATPVAVGGLVLCTTGADLNCTANACAGAGVINNGIAMREILIERDAAAPLAQTGFLNIGPGFFGNRKDISGKFVMNNYYGDATAMYFTGDARVPGGCVGGTTPPTVVGWENVHYNNAASLGNYIQVLLADGQTFAFRNNGSQSGLFTGVCCSGVQIRRIIVHHDGDSTEGLDNIRWGNCAGTCTPSSGGPSVNVNLGPLEALACNLLRLEHTPDGQKVTNDAAVQSICKTTYSWNGTSSCGPQGIPEPVTAPDPCGGQCKGTSENKPGCP